MTPILVAPALTILTVLPGIDTDALIGAFAGAAALAVSSQQMSCFKRFAYLVISLIAGYFAGPELVRLTPIESTGMGAFLAAATTISITLRLIERAAGFDLKTLFKK